MSRAFVLLLAAVIPAGCGRGEQGADPSAGGEVAAEESAGDNLADKAVDPAATGWPLQPPAEGAAAVTADRKLPGQYPAGSRFKDRQSPKGFGGCDNYPFQLGDRNWGTPGELSLVAFPDESVAYFRHRGLALRVINRTSEPVPLAACDSMLGIVRQARHGDGWRDIETAAEPICGRSFHRVILEPNAYLQFPAREYAGPINARLRFRLDPGGSRPPIYSNEFDGHVTPAQLRDAAGNAPAVGRGPPPAAAGCWVVAAIQP